LNLRHTKPFTRTILVLLYLGLVTLLSLLPTSDLPNIPFINGQDKVVHAVMYFGLSFLAAWSLDARRHRWYSTPLMLLGVFLWGALMEILQLWMAMGRGFEWYDMLADLAGALAGIIIYRTLYGIHTSDYTSRR